MFLKTSQRTKEFDKNNNDVLSIPDYVIKKHTRGAKHGPSERQRMYCKATGNVAKSSSTQAESLCQKLGGPKSKLSNMTRLPWRMIHTSQPNLKEIKIQNIGYSD